MRSRYKAIEGDHPYFVTSTVVQWIPVFTSAAYCNVITDSLLFCRKQKSLLLHAYVVMDTHIHLIVTAPDVTSFMRDFKSFTSRKIIDLLHSDNKTWLLERLEFFKKEYKLESSHQIWQEGFHPEMISSEEMLRQKADYLHLNPVRRGLVSSPEQWVYSSAQNYSLGTGNIEIDRLN
jgi:REP element-mobilizing transposase RayT